MFPGVSAHRSFVLDRPIETCPSCGSARVFPVRRYDDQYRCNTCASCWSPGAPRPKRVDPVTCPGCGDREECFDRLRSEVGRWGPPVLD